MQGREPDYSWRKLILLLLVAFSLAFAGTAAVWEAGQTSGPARQVLGLASDIAGSLVHLFTTRYPANEMFRSELQTLRSSGKLKAEDEALIRKTTLAASSHLHMPPAVLWCLLFQESRLDRLAGVAENRAATGLGQFGFSSFYEVNFHLDHFGMENREMVIGTLGSDVRPVGAFRQNLDDPSSYYHIPTAVVMSAAYLNNRYLQLRRALDRKNVSYDPSLIWLYAAMAYNKGTRTVFSLWNEAMAKGGRPGLQKLVSDHLTFFRSFREAEPFHEVLARIWSEEEAEGYAQELKVHTNHMRDCAVADEDQFKFREPAAKRRF